MTVLLTGGIGSGKSAVRRILEGFGVPCYDADTAVKAFYAVPLADGGAAIGRAHGTGCPDAVTLSAFGKPFLLPEIESSLGQSFRRQDGSFDSRKLAETIFRNSARLKTVEGIVFPALAADFERWRKSVEEASAASGTAGGEHANMSSAAGVVVFESATALDKPEFPKVWDRCLWVDAPEELRIERVMARDHCTREQVLSRLRLQSPHEAHRSEIDAIILNDCSLQELSSRVRTALVHLISEY